MSKPLYLAGPMSGIPEFNLPAFTSALDTLGEMGYNIMLPHDMSSVHELEGFLEGRLDDEYVYADYIAEDIRRLMTRCSGIVLLPDWNTSRGARIEASVAMSMSYPVYTLVTEGVTQKLKRRSYAFILAELGRGYGQEY